MLLDWNNIQNIHVTADFGMTPYDGYFGGGYDLIVHHKVKTTGFSRSALAELVFR